MMYVKDNQNLVLQEMDNFFANKFRFLNIDQSQKYTLLYFDLVVSSLQKQKDIIDNQYIDDQLIDRTLKKYKFLNFYI